MVSVTVVCGSADAGGITRGMCDAACRYLESEGCDVRLFIVSDMDIGHCRDCKGCVSGECVIEDGMSEIYGAVSESDVLIMATPLHFSAPSSLLKTVMDRFQPYWHDKGRKHPKVFAGLLCGGSWRPFFEVTERIFRSFCLSVGMRYLGSAKVSGTDYGDPDCKDTVDGFLDSVRDGMGL